MPSLRPRPSAIPLAVDGGVAASIRRTTVVRAVLAVALVALLVTATLLARRIQPRTDAFVPGGSTAVLVIDLSQSIPHGSFPTIGKVLQHVADDNVPVGLVIFSDTAYELLPPGTPGRELRPFLRYFTPLPGAKTSSVWDASFPDNPWSQVFRGGTHISAALATARSMLERAGIRHGSIVLISDLEAPAQDVPPLTSILSRLERDHITLRIVPLFPSLEARTFFRRLVPASAFTNADEGVVSDFAKPTPVSGPPAPGALIGIGVLLLLALAWNEGWLARLPIPSRTREART